MLRSELTIKRVANSCRNCKSKAFRLLDDLEQTVSMASHKRGFSAFIWEALWTVNDFVTGKKIR